MLVCTWKIVRKPCYQYYGNSCFIASLFPWWVILRNNVPMKQKKVCLLQHVLHVYKSIGYLEKLECSFLSCIIWTLKSKLIKSHFKISLLSDNFKTNGTIFFKRRGWKMKVAQTILRILEKLFLPLNLDNC